MNENDQSQKTNRIQDKLNRQNSQLKTDLKHGLEYTNLIHQVINVSDDNELMNATKKLSEFKLDTKLVNFIDHYHPSDYYSLFMYRFISLHQSDFNLVLDFNTKVTLKFFNIKYNNEFKYEYDSKNKTAYFKDLKYNLAIFTLNLDQKELQFNSNNLVNLFIVKFHDHMKINDVKKELQVLIRFSYDLKKYLKFNINLNILNTNNDMFYKFNQNDLPSYVIDKLFVMAANNHYMLTSYHGSGAKLDLGHGVQLKLFNYEKDIPQWGMIIDDKDQKISWFDIILQFDFLRKWYLDNIKFLQISLN